MQKQLAQKSGKTQPTISSLELSCESTILKTLTRLASAFDVALDVRFVPFSELLSAEQRNLDSTVPSFEQDTPPLRNELSLLIRTASQSGGFDRVPDTGAKAVNILPAARSEIEGRVHG